MAMEAITLEGEHVRLEPLSREHRFSIVASEWPELKRGLQEKLRG